jgi:hypothetical protein
LALFPPDVKAHDALDVPSIVRCSLLLEDHRSSRISFAHCLEIWEKEYET